MMLALSVAILALSYYLYLLCEGHYSLSYSYDKEDEKAFSTIRKRIKGDGYERYDEYIPISAPGNESLHAWVYVPNRRETSYVPNEITKKPPVIVMAHGLGSQKDMGLDNYARAFAREGFAVLLMDYRRFGGSLSDGEYRNLIDPFSHVEDILQAIGAVRDGKVADGIVDIDRVFLWGTSFAGGHMLVVAAKLRELGFIRGVISQVPHLDGRAASLRSMQRRGIVGCARVLVLALADIVRSRLLGLSPVYVKIAGVGGETAYMSMTEYEYAVYLSKHPYIYVNTDDGTDGKVKKYQYLGSWQNKAPARTLLLISRYSPIKFASDVYTPVLFVGSTNDPLCPLEAIHRARDLLPLKARSELLELDCSHSGVYVGEAFDTAVARMIAFLKNINNEI